MLSTVLPSEYVTPYSDNYGVLIKLIIETDQDYKTGHLDFTIPPLISITSPVLSGFYSSSSFFLQLPTLATSQHPHSSRPALHLLATHTYNIALVTFYSTSSL